MWRWSFPGPMGPIPTSGAKWNQATGSWPPLPTPKAGPGRFQRFSLWSSPAEPLAPLVLADEGDGSDAPFHQISDLMEGHGFKPGLAGLGGVMDLEDLKPR